RTRPRAAHSPAHATKGATSQHRPASPSPVWSAQHPPALRRPHLARTSPPPPTRGNPPPSCRHASTSVSARRLSPARAAPAGRPASAPPRRAPAPLRNGRWRNCRDLACRPPPTAQRRDAPPPPGRDKAPPPEPQDSQFASSDLRTSGRIGVRDKPDLLHRFQVVHLADCSPSEAYVGRRHKLVESGVERCKFVRLHAAVHQPHAIIVVQGRAVRPRGG